MFFADSIAGFVGFVSHLVFSTEYYVEELETGTQLNDWSSVFWRYFFGAVVFYLSLKLVLCLDATVVACDIIISLETVLCQLCLHK